MKHWIGRWLMIVSLLHCIVAVAVFGGVYISITQRGVFNAVGIILMPVSGFWLISPPAIAVLVRKA